MVNTLYFNEEHAHRLVLSDPLIVDLSIIQFGQCHLLLKGVVNKNNTECCPWYK